ncbi:MAG TPA: hypothetical protein VF257_05270 [Solirubrobacteraceae bacterium]
MVGVLIPVGPSAAELGRLDDLLESLAHWERPDVFHLVIVDDARRPRAALERIAGWASVTVVRTPLWQRRRVPEPFAAMTAGTLMAIEAAPVECEFLLKLDVDALVIGRFVSKIRHAFAEDETLGLVGSHDVTCTGAQRDWSVWHGHLQRLGRRVRLGRHGRRLFLQRRRAGDVRRSIALLDAAQRNGYALGANCLGGAYAIGPRLMSRRDLLDWRPWAGTGLGEDIVMGVLCGAAGLRMRSLTGPGEPFGIAHVGLPKPPRELIADGHSLVHAVKANAATERAWRQEFRAARGA